MNFWLSVTKFPVVETDYDVLLKKQLKYAWLCNGKEESISFPEATEVLRQEGNGL